MLKKTITNNFPTVYKKLKKVEGWLSPEQGELLYNYAKKLEVEGDIVEIGSYQGKSTICLAYGLLASRYANRKVFAIDPHTGDRSTAETRPETQFTLETLPFFLRNLVQFKVENTVVPIVAKSDDYYKFWERGQIRLLYVDGWHAYQACYNDITQWGKFVPKGGVIVVDDYVYSDEIKQATEDAGRDMGWGQPQLQEPYAIFEIE